MSLSAGDIVDGKYRILRLIGEGGMGAVYEGENIRIHRRVAIKVLHSEVANTTDAVQRFEREAQAAGRIGSKHIVEVLDLGDLLNGERYMVMEFMDGDSLSAYIRKADQLPVEEIYPIAHQLLEGLHAAHNAGIIHRDLKPDNVYVLDSQGNQPKFVKILDFGVSKFTGLSDGSGLSMTRTGAVMGTPYYMAPEQAKGAKGMDHRADLYAVGVILYECATGRVPFSADTFNELLFKIALEDPTPIELLVGGIDLGFCELVRKAMAREPAHRFQTAKEFQQALEQWAVSARISIPSPDLTGQRPALVSIPNDLPALTPPTPPRTPSPEMFSSPDNTYLTGTQAAWSGENEPKKSNLGLIAGVLVGSALLAGGVYAIIDLGRDVEIEPNQLVPNQGAYTAASQPESPKIDEPSAEPDGGAAEPSSADAGAQAAQNVQGKGQTKAPTVNRPAEKKQGPNAGSNDKNPNLNRTLRESL